MTASHRRPRSSLQNPVGLFVKIEQDTRTRMGVLAGHMELSLAEFVDVLIQGIQIVDGKPALTWHDPERDQKAKRAPELPLAG